MVTAATVAPEYLANPQIPIDLFVSKKHPGLTRGNIGFADSSGKIVFKIQCPKSSLSRHRKKRVLLLLDGSSSANPLISMNYKNNECWEGYNGEKKELIINAKRTLNTLTRSELEVFVVGPNGELGSEPNFKVKGCPFQRSCTIYRDNSVVAQTSLMYKLNQIYVGRKKFRLTIYPEAADHHSLLVALVAIFVYGKR